MSVAQVLDSSSQVALARYHKSELAKNSRRAGTNAKIAYANAKASMEEKKRKASELRKSIEEVVIQYQASKRHEGWETIIREDRAGKKTEVVQEIAFWDESLWLLIEEAFEPMIFFQSKKWKIISAEDVDLAQEGRLALSWAAKYWKPGGSTTFSTFAFRCIRNTFIDMRNGGSAMKEMRIDQGVWDESWISDTHAAGPDPLTQEEVELRMMIEKLDVTPRQKIILLGLMQGHLKGDIARQLNYSAMMVTWEVKDLAQNEQVRSLLGQV